ncbi:MAG: hypothetical protein IK095_04890 [Oscillospiraceae bacterium]|nr:hypothetical protein [Oscillospiraceae bacterium]
MKALSKRDISYRALAALVLAALLLALIPLLMMGHYDVPCADDYNYGVNARLVYVHGGAPAQILGAAVERTRVTYEIWQGSYSAIFLMCLQPSVFSEDLYCITPWLMLGSLLLGLFLLSLVLFRRVLDLPRSLGAIFAGTVGILWILLVPIPAQSFYWFNGSVYYTFFFGIALAALALAVRTARQGGIGRILGLCLLAAFLGGGNLVTGLSLAILSVSAIGSLLVFRKRAPALRLLAPALVMLGCFIINIAAPGNAIRAQAVDHTPNAVQAIMLSFREAVLLGLKWTRLPVIAAMLLLGYLFWHAVPATPFRFRFPGLVSLYSFCLYSAMFCPTMYALGSRGDWRLVDIIFYAYLLLLGLNVLYWVGWIRQRRGAGSDARQPKLLPVLGCLALCLLCLGISAKISGGISVASAYTALRTDQAATYARENRERFEILHDPAVREARLRPYSDPPYLLFFDDITEDPENWRNVGVQVFYEKDRVYLDTSR